MNAAFEDCTVLNRCLVERAPDWKTAFATYESCRKIHVDTLAVLCLDNFIEMRDRVGSQTFLLKKRWEVFLHKLFPKWYLPLYTLVTFTCTPYAEALRRVRTQDRIVRGVVALLALGIIGLIAWWCW